MNRCACGCGKEAKPGKKFVQGHNGALEYRLGHALPDAKPARVPKQVRTFHKNALKLAAALKNRGSQPWEETPKDERGKPLACLARLQRVWEYRLAREGLGLERGRLALCYGWNGTSLDVINTPEQRRRNRENYLLWKAFDGHGRRIPAAVATARQNEVKSQAPQPSIEPIASEPKLIS